MTKRREYKVGDTVNVAPFKHDGVVRKAGFIGVINEIGAGYYNITAPDGSGWCRTRREFKRVAANDNTPPAEVA